MNCPRDQATLRETVIDGAVVRICPQCQGFFIKLDEVRGLGVSAKRMRAATSANKLTAPKATAASPVTGQPMLMFHYEGVEIDYCTASNSVWIDGDELTKVKTVRVKLEVATSRKRSLTDTIIDGISPAIDSVVIDFIGNAIGSLFDGL